jgi:TPP-dependent indolepyruvate ferredoxin oxidoreductase alpha subunit
MRLPVGLEPLPDGPVLPGRAQHGKGPGVDRSGDAFRHGNFAGSAPGGVLRLAGDDHTCKSSTTSHQSEYALMDAMIPVLNPAGVQEILEFGLIAWALSGIQVRLLGSPQSDRRDG